MRNVWKYLILIFLSAVTLGVLKLNLNLYSESSKKSEIQSDIILQLNFIENGLKKDNLGDEMQRLFPEGFVFVNVLYGLTWCELAFSNSTNNKVFKKKAKTEALYAYRVLCSSKAYSNFDQTLMPKYGIFYFGWKNYLLSKILLTDKNIDEKDSLVKLYKAQCDSLALIISGTEKTYMESYALQSWPADLFVAMASLSNHDKIFKPKYNKVINGWLGKVNSHLDKETQLIPHKVDSETGNTLDGARGSSMALILRMMNDINPKLGNEYFKKFKSQFVTTTFGLPSLREYPIGSFGLGDVDSGPVIFGVGFSGTIVMIGVLAMFDSSCLSQKQYNTINAFGFEQIKNKQKQYMFGKLPMADAFIAWGRASALNYHDRQSVLSKFWGYKFHLFSLLFVSILWILFFMKKLINLIKVGLSTNRYR